MSIPPDNGNSKATQFMLAHWLTIANLLIFLFILPIILYPLFMATGVPLPQDTAGVIKFLYHFICHQLPRRSPSTALPSSSACPFPGGSAPAGNCSGRPRAITSSG